MQFFVSFLTFLLFFIVSFCIYFTGVAAKKGCPAREMPEPKNANKRSDLKDDYSDTDYVRFSCISGFVGFFRLTCKDGSWMETRLCEPKQCGHPGDTLNGDFTLVKGDDFVFGSMVQYTCRKGYTMASRMSHRSCLTSGWDYNVPVCEVVRCEPLYPPQNLEVSGNFDAPQYSDVVEFECPPAEKLNGPRQIYCTETGDWSGQTPTCQEISCLRPDIQNSIPEDKKIIYKKDEVIRFQCKQNYIAVGSGISKCTRDGWTMPCRCEEFKCKAPVGLYLDLTSFHATEYEVGEKVEYACLEKYKKTEVNATCTLSNWTPQIMCEEITCEKIPNGHFRYWVNRIVYGTYIYDCDKGYKKAQFRTNCTADGWVPKVPCEEITCIKPPNVKYGRNTFRFGSHAYSCEDGYRRTSNLAQCTENGWMPKVLCEWTELTRLECKIPTLKNGYIVRAKHEAAISYACDEGHKPKTGGWWGYIKCTNGNWSETPRCIDKHHCGALPAITNGRYKENKDEYSNGMTVEADCNVGYATKCISESVKVPACTAEKRCDDTSAIDKSNKEADCGLAKCISGTWQLPQCTAECELPPLRNGYMVRAKHELALSYACNEAFKPKTEGWWGYITCVNGSWSDTPLCIGEKNCKALPPFYNVTKKMDLYRNSDNVTIQCQLGYFSKCVNGSLECTETCTRVDDNSGKGSMDLNGDSCKAERETGFSAICINGEWKFESCTDKMKDLSSDTLLDK